MDKSILKKFAIESREMLMTAVENQLNKYYVDEELEKTQSGDLIILKNNRVTLQPLTFDEFNKRATLISRIKDLSEDGSFESGKKHVIEETAYTWFNRIVAIRYMELNDMLPLTKDNQSLGIRVLSSINNESHPEILKLGNLTNTGLDLKINFDKYNKLLNENEQFNYVLKLICNKIGTIIPQVFDGITDYIDLLLPENLLSDNGFVTKVIKEVPECNFKEGVEIIGWLYQYYNQKEKDRVINAKKQYKKNEIAYATQLFTPDWIVKYMVENSLGRYWIEHNGDNDLINNWKYFIKDNIKGQKDRVKVAEIKFIDPCCGSGHILVYAFEVLYQIYREQGYNKNDIPELILKNNLFGLDIDDRAGQLSILSVILKAREYDTNIFNKNIIKNLNIFAIQETNNVNKSDLDIIKTDNEISEIVDYVYDIFQNAKEIGSLLRIEKRDYDKVMKIINALNNKQLDIFDIEKVKAINEKIMGILKIAKILSNKYECVVTNPPYMNNKYMSNLMKKFTQNNYEQYKNDLFSMFIFKSFDINKENGYIGMVSPFVWMFIQSYEKLRDYIVNNKHIESLIQLEYNAFEVACVPVCTFVFKNSNVKDDKGTYIRLSDYPGADMQETKTLEAINDNKCSYKYIVDTKIFKKIPDEIIAYWIPTKLYNIFKENKKIEEYGNPKKGLSTGDNNRFLRLWWEVESKKIGYNLDKYNEKYKWIPLNKGGDYRRWYGNNDYIINWEFDGKELKAFDGSVIRNESYYFKKSITWTMLSSKLFGVRASNKGKIFEGAGPSLFVEDKDYEYILGLMLSKVGRYFINVFNPTMNINISDISNIPVIYDENRKDEVVKLVKENIEIEKREWDSYETSNDFSNEIFNFAESTLNDTFNKIKEQNDKGYKRLKSNEERLNQIFIELYNLSEQIDYKMQSDEITYKKINKEQYIKQFISYFVGCLFGRYSLDRKGVILSDNKIMIDNYKKYQVDEDNIIPVTEEKYFKNDIVERFIHFIEVVYGKETVNENLDYIADTLGRKNNEDAEDTIRRYFVNDFYKDHIKIYQKKPIYWMFESGKKNGFKCLIYMHRYDENLVAKIRLDYLDKIQRIYEARLQEIKTDLEDSNLSNYDAKKLEKEQESLQIKLEEIKKYNDKLSTIGNKKIKIDLDDGVTENYKKFLYVDPITNKESSILAEEKTIIPKKK